MTLEEMADFALEAATACVAEYGSVSPIFLVVLPSGQMMPVVTPYNSDAQRLIVMSALREMMADAAATAYSFTYEGWTLPPIPVGGDLPAVRAREHPDRIESLIVDCHNVAGERIVIVAKIERAGGRKRVGEVMMRERAAKTETGDMVNLLMPRPAVH